MGLLGIDLGTSSVKAVVIDERAEVLGVASYEYPILTPQPGWAEQEPQQWWDAVTRAVRQAVAQAGIEIKAMGLSGLMHGPVLIDAQHQPVGASIIWADQRSVQEVEDITARVGTERLARIAGTAPAAGFMAPTLLWLQRHDPWRLKRTAACLLPKDYVRLLLTGNIATEASDASATALFDVQQRVWSWEIIDLLGFPRHIFPDMIETSQIGGTLTKTAAEALGLTAGIPVVAGCADQVAQAIGNGLLDPGNGSVTLGSGGQVFIPLDQPVIDEQLRVHLFCHAPADRWYLLGAMLTAGLSLRWLRDLLGLTHDANAYNDLSKLVAAIPPGADGLLFLPYLVGERSPLMDPLARGSFVGLTLRHSRGHLARAIMEGVAFALRQIIETIISLGVPIHQLLAAGNGLASPVWRQIAADVLNRPLALHPGRERTGVGAALLAGLGAGMYSSYAEIQQIVAAASTLTEPNPPHVAFYDDQYRRFCDLYLVLKPTFHELSKPPS
jgi:xylulokinase